MTDAFAAAPRPKVPIFRTAYDGYRLGIGAIFGNFAMFRYFVYGSVLWISLIGYEFYDSFSSTTAVMRGGAGRPIIGDIIIAILFAVAIAAVQTPMCIALQRRVLLGEAPKQFYFAHLLSQAGSRYLLATFLVQAFFLGASLSQYPVIMLFGHDPTDPVALSTAMSDDPTFLWTVVLELLAAYLAAAWFAVRLTFAFPEIACDRWRGSVWLHLAETKGTNARLFFLFILILLPIPVLYVMLSLIAVIVFVVRHMAAGGDATSSDFLINMFSSTEIIVATIVLVLGVAVSWAAVAAGAARAYQIRVERGLSGLAEVFS